MLSDITKSLLEFLKLAPRYLLAVIIVCAIFLFAPASFPQTIGITAFVESYRQWIGFVLICSFGVWVVAITTSASEWRGGPVRLDRISFLLSDISAGF